ncbi:uncharacterized protein LOC131929984 [Physella acuta]|uniref:uncharacterized protein LOC131929984 n=1 Tax=Physella acuta TaxID=109671 RepID=UPI0027DACCA2|nr:uncharacterized protein LOC131929984 [Physella acuta]
MAQLKCRSMSSVFIKHMTEKDDFQTICLTEALIDFLTLHPVSENGKSDYSGFFSKKRKASTTPEAQKTKKVKGDLDCKLSHTTLKQKLNSTEATLTTDTHKQKKSTKSRTNTCLHDSHNLPPLSTDCQATLNSDLKCGAMPSKIVSIKHVCKDEGLTIVPYLNPNLSNGSFPNPEATKKKDNYNYNEEIAENSVGTLQNLIPHNRGAANRGNAHTNKKGTEAVSSNFSIGKRVENDGCNNSKSVENGVQSHRNGSGVAKNRTDRVENNGHSSVQLASHVGKFQNIISPLKGSTAKTANTVRKPGKETIVPLENGSPVKTVTPFDEYSAGKNETQQTTLVAGYIAISKNTKHKKATSAVSSKDFSVKYEASTENYGVKNVPQTVVSPAKNTTRQDKQPQTVVSPAKNITRQDKQPQTVVSPAKNLTRQDKQPQTVVSPAKNITRQDKQPQFVVSPAKNTTRQDKQPQTVVSPAKNITRQDKQPQFVVSPAKNTTRQDKQPQTVVSPAKNTTRQDNQPQTVVSPAKNTTRQDKQPQTVVSPAKNTTRPDKQPQTVVSPAKNLTRQDKQSLEESVPALHATPAPCSPVLDVRYTTVNPKTSAGPYSSLAHRQKDANTSKEYVANNYKKSPVKSTVIKADYEISPKVKIIRRIDEINKAAINTKEQNINKTTSLSCVDSPVPNKSSHNHKQASRKRRYHYTAKKASNSRENIDSKSSKRNLKSIDQLAANLANVKFGLLLSAVTSSRTSTDSIESDKHCSKNQTSKSPNKPQRRKRRSRSSLCLTDEETSVVKDLIRKQRFSTAKSKDRSAALESDAVSALLSLGKNALSKQAEVEVTVSAAPKEVATSRRRSSLQQQVDVGEAEDVGHTSSQDDGHTTDREFGHTSDRDDSRTSDKDVGQTFSKEGGQTSDTDVVFLYSEASNKDFVSSVLQSRLSHALDQSGAISIPDQNCATSIPDESCATSIPDESCTTSIPDQNCATSIPDQNCATSIPDQNCATSIPDQNCTTSIPDQNCATSIPDQNCATSIPDQNCATSIPDQNFATSIPDQNCATSIPDQNCATSIPDQNCATSIPEQNCSTSIPDQNCATSIPDPSGAKPVPDQKCVTTVSENIKQLIRCRLQKNGSKDKCDNEEAPCFGSSVEAPAERDCACKPYSSCSCGTAAGDKLSTSLGTQVIDLTAETTSAHDLELQHDSGGSDGQSCMTDLAPSFRNGSARLVETDSSVITDKDENFVKNGSSDSLLTGFPEESLPRGDHNPYISLSSDEDCSYDISRSPPPPRDVAPSASKAPDGQGFGLSTSGAFSNVGQADIVFLPQGGCLNYSQVAFLSTAATSSDLAIFSGPVVTSSEMAFLPGPVVTSSEVAFLPGPVVTSSDVAFLSGPSTTGSAIFNAGIDVSVANLQHMDTQYTDAGGYFQNVEIRNNTPVISLLCPDNGNFLFNLLNQSVPSSGSAPTHRTDIIVNENNADSHVYIILNSLDGQPLMQHQTQVLVNSSSDSGGPVDGQPLMQHQTQVLVNSSSDSGGPVDGQPLMQHQTQVLVNSSSDSGGPVDGQPLMQHQTQVLVNSSSDSGGPVDYSLQGPAGGPSSMFEVSTQQTRQPNVFFLSGNPQVQPTLNKRRPRKLKMIKSPKISPVSNGSHAGSVEPKNLTINSLNILTGDDNVISSAKGSGINEQVPAVVALLGEQTAASSTLEPGNINIRNCKPSGSVGASLNIPESSHRDSPAGDVGASLNIPESSHGDPPAGDVGASLNIPESSHRNPPAGDIGASLNIPESSHGDPPAGDVGASLNIPESSHGDPPAGDVGRYMSAPKQMPSGTAASRSSLRNISVLKHSQFLPKDGASHIPASDSLQHNLHPTEASAPECQPVSSSMADISGVACKVGPPLPVGSYILSQKGENLVIKKMIKTLHKSVTTQDDSSVAIVKSNEGKCSTSIHQVISNERTHSTNSSHGKSNEKTHSNNSSPGKSNDKTHSNSSHVKSNRRKHSTNSCPEKSNDKTHSNNSSHGKSNGRKHSANRSPLKPNKEKCPTNTPVVKSNKKKYFTKVEETQAERKSIQEGINTGKLLTPNKKTSPQQREHVVISHPQQDATLLKKESSSLCEEDNTVRTTDERDEACCSMPPPGFQTKHPSDWSVDDVAQWLTHHGLQQFVPHFSSMKGEDLLNLKRLQTVKPKEFFHHMISLGEPFFSVIKFSRYLRPLHS